MRGKPCTHRYNKLAAWFILFSASVALSSTPQSQAKLEHPNLSTYKRWLSATNQSLNCMRPKDGLIADAALVDHSISGPCPLNISNSVTSPTNIGFDLLVLLQENSPELEPTLRAVEQLNVDPETGLYYNWYSIKSPFEVQYPYLSSVDNFHLALAFWVLSKDHPDTNIRNRAQKLFDQMNFSKFLHEDSQLVRGGISESWAYKHFGTEARAIYSLGWKIGIFKTIGPDGKRAKRTQTPQEKAKMFESLVFESANLPIEDREIESIATWDGGAFQLLLPELLIGESSRSLRYKIFFDNYARFIESETIRRNLPVPASHSASQFCVAGCEGVPTYNGKAGSLKLVSKLNQDPGDSYLHSMWEAVFTPHAAILSLLTSEKIFNRLQKAETIRGLYDNRIGWSDGFWVSDPKKNEVVPVLLALDQQMISMTLSRLTSNDNQSVSQRALNRDPEIKAHLNEFYALTENKFISYPSLTAKPQLNVTAQNP